MFFLGFFLSAVVLFWKLLRSLSWTYCLSISFLDQDENIRDCTKFSFLSCSFIPVSIREFLRTARWYMYHPACILPFLNCSFTCPAQHLSTPSFPYINYSHSYQSFSLSEPCRLLSCQENISIFPAISSLPSQLFFCQVSFFPATFLVKPEAKFQVSCCILWLAAFSVDKSTGFSSDFSSFSNGLSAD